MLTHDVISEKVNKIAPQYPLKRVAYFGSYASGKQTEDSDLDILVEFLVPSVSLLTLAEIKYTLEDELSVPVDIIHYPLPEDALIEVNEMVTVYEQ